MSVLVVGSVAYDGIETPAGKVDRTLGGSATHISLASSYLADDVRLLATVGKDFAQEDIDKFKNRGINLDGFNVDENERTFFWRGRYHDDLNTRDTLETQLNVIEKFDPVVPDSLKGSRYICLGNLDPISQKKVLDQVTTPQLSIGDTMNFWIEGMNKELKETIASLDILIVNDEEARQLSGKNNLVEAAEVIRNMGPSILIIKKGEHGAMLFTDDGFFTAPGLPLREIKDPTGAGDSFLGGFAGWLSKTDDHSFENLKRAVIYGSVMASFCVEDFGPQRFSDISSYAISDRYDKFREIASVPSSS